MNIRPGKASEEIQIQLESRIMTEASLALSWTGRKDVQHTAHELKKTHPV
ncbi:MAG: hypothetical protein JW774_07435 [Candidatus Aureabacteria bacterium]|nr:hypothetical protein [Candidatus Auribacterota bacterium]